MSNIALQPVDAASITVLVDNQVTYPLPDNCTGWPATAALAAQCPDIPRGICNTPFGCYSASLMEDGQHRITLSSIREADGYVYVPAPAHCR